MGSCPSLLFFSAQSETERDILLSEGVWEVSQIPSGFFMAGEDCLLPQ